MVEYVGPLTVYPEKKDVFRESVTRCEMRKKASEQHPRVQPERCIIFHVETRRKIARDSSPEYIDNVVSR